MSTPLGAEANKSLFRDSSNVIVLNYSTWKNHYQNRELPSLGMDATFHSRRPVGASARAAFTDTGADSLSRLPVNQGALHCWKLSCAKVGGICNDITG